MGDEKEVGDWMLGRSGSTVVLLTRRSRSWRCFAGGVRQGRRALVEEQPEERKKAAGLLLLLSLAEDGGKQGEDLLAVNQRWPRTRGKQGGDLGEDMAQVHADGEMGKIGG